MIKTLLKGARPLLCLVVSLFMINQAHAIPAGTFDLAPSSPDTLNEYLQSLLYISPMIALPADPTEESLLETPAATATLYPLLYPTHDASIETAEPKEPSTMEQVLSFLKPVQAPISSVYGMRWGRPHRGIDLAGPIGTPIRAAEDGKVIYSGRNGDFGNFVAIDHGHGYVTRYAHASRLLVKKGQHVEQGQVIAKIGNTGRSTGPHLHFEVLANGSHRNPQQVLNQTISLAHK